MNLERPREVKFYQSANRHNQVLGGDRELVLLSGMFAAIFIFSVGKMWGFPVGIVIWIACVAVLSRLGKADPMMRFVYMRHIHYKSFYPAKSGVDRESAGTPKSW